MTRIGLILGFLCIVLFCNAQLIHNKSLIINGDLEQFTDTPSCVAGLNGLFYWYSPTLHAVTYCHSLVNQNWPNFNCWAEIKNGYEPHSGVAYVLTILYADSLISSQYSSMRKYFAQKLIKELEKDSTYCFRMYIRYWPHINRVTTNKIGVHLSVDSIYEQTYNNLSVIPQLESDSDMIFNDSLHWISFSKKYKASGGERYITIGNFRNNANTPLFLINPSLPHIEDVVYVLLDDIGLYKNECPTEEDTTKTPVVFNKLQIPSAFTPNNDGKNDVFRVLGSPQVSNFKLCVYNRWGKQVYCGNSIYDGWDGNCNGSPCEMATYQWVATYTDVLSGEQRMERGNVTLIR